MSRLFFAALPDEGTRARLLALIAEPLRRKGRESRRDEVRRESGRAVGREGGSLVPVPIENYHLTLAFVGAATPAQLEAVRAIGASLRGRPCEVRLEALEWWRRAGVLALAARLCPPELAQIHARLRDALGRAGFARDLETFRPHVTVARKVTQAPVLPRVLELTWPVREVALLDSDTSGKTSRYTVLDTWPLLDEPAMR
ncbi:MAG TPA: RNA 2',3'-cyclic phosphodiesterase [Steroidobacteraceae bacterium]|nr:RNA 2',3'-cyclic phosphodiesterase [Steroidobacteraceae bacterium]